MPTIPAAAASAAALTAATHVSAFSTNSFESGASTPIPCAYASRSHASDACRNRGSRRRCAIAASDAASAAHTAVRVTPETSTAAPSADTASAIAQRTAATSRSRRQREAETSTYAPATARSAWPRPSPWKRSAADQPEKTAPRIVSEPAA
jgi:hypothetical protein